MSVENEIVKECVHPEAGRLFFICGGYNRGECTRRDCQYQISHVGSRKYE